MSRRGGAMTAQFATRWLAFGGLTVAVFLVWFGMVQVCEALVGEVD